MSEREQMLAARFHGAGDIRVERVDRPGPLEPGEVLIRPLAAGVCGSDAMEFSAGPVIIHPLDTTHPVTGHRGPLTLGHEFAGTVVAVGSAVEGLAPGMLVACGAGISCGTCAPCRAGRTNLCTTYATVGFHRDGGLAELCAVPAEICIDVGGYGIGPDVAALAQPMAIAVHAARRGRVAVREEVLIVGVGGIGTFLTYAAAAAGAHVTVVDLDEERLRIATALGAANAIVAQADRPLPAVLAELGVVPDVVFEVTGSAQALADAIAVVPRGGRIVSVGVQKAAAPVDMRRVTLDELELIGTVAHVCREDLPAAAELLASRAEGWGDVAPVVLALDRVVEDGVRPIAERTSDRIKSLFDPQASAAAR